MHLQASTFIKRIDRTLVLVILGMITQFLNSISFAENCFRLVLALTVLFLVWHTFVDNITVMTTSDSDDGMVGSPLWLHRLYIPIIWVVSLLTSAAFVLRVSLEKPAAGGGDSNTTTTYQDHFQSYTLDDLLDSTFDQSDETEILKGVSCRYILNL